MLKILNALQKKRWVVGASCSVHLPYLHSDKLISDTYPKNDKSDTLSGIIYTRWYVIRFTSKDQLCTFMQHEGFWDHEFHCAHRWVKFNIEVIEAHVLNISKIKIGRGVEGVRLNMMLVRLLFMKLLKSIYMLLCIMANNSMMIYLYQQIKNQELEAILTEHYIKLYGSGIYRHNRRAVGCLKYSEKLDRMN